MNLTKSAKKEIKKIVKRYNSSLGDSHFFLSIRSVKNRGPVEERSSLLD